MVVENNVIAQSIAASVVHEAKGMHLLLTLFNCASDLLNDEEQLRKLINKAAVASGATVMKLDSQKFEPQGVTAFAVLAESHASLHTYPESRTVFFDCFTCGTTCDPTQCVAVLVDALKPEATQHRYIERG